METDLLEKWGPFDIRVDGGVSLEVQQGELLVRLAGEEEGLLAREGSRDIWQDKEAVHYLQEGRCELWWSPALRKAVARRVKPYSWRDGKLYRLMADGSKREVPPVLEREQIISATRTFCGHFGEKRTISLVQASYWWYGLYRDVCSVVRACELWVKGECIIYRPISPAEPLAY